MPEFLLPAYYWGLVFLLPLAQQYPGQSTQILLGFALLMFMLFIFDILRKKRLYFNGSFFFIAAALAVLFFDTAFRGNSVSGRYLYEFIYSPLIMTLFLSQVINVRKLLFNFSILSAVGFVAFCWDPLNNYAIFGDYMDFGFKVAMPAFFGLYIGVHFLKIKWMVILEVLCLIETLVFANRSAFLSVIIFVFLMLIMKGEFNLRKALKYCLIAGSIVLLILNMNYLFFILYDFVSSLGYTSYALNQAKDFLYAQDLINVFTGRAQIWLWAQDMAAGSPLIGYGIGAFEDRTGMYSHSIYFDILLFYGYAGMAVIAGLLFCTVRAVLSWPLVNKVLAILLFCLWCPKLFFSIYFTKEPAFWCFIALCFMSRQLKPDHLMVPARQEVRDHESIDRKL